LQQVKTPEDFYQSAVAFGNFQKQLAGYPAATLHETIPHFHDTPRRFENFEKALAADVMGRAKDVADEIAFVRARKADCAYMTDLLAAGKLPLRVTHNDTKLNNILFDKESGEGLCVIDLDTVMPGLAANDFGDSIRFGANHSAEDEPDLSKVNFAVHGGNDLQGHPGGVFAPLGSLLAQVFVHAADVLHQA
ncbi:phosphotransferase enzyme family protein, partial [Gemmiger formicilis]|uniref:phosphotransferase enzyme family protein n=1 Tax=Gemmiger formicilis TaxID=745368 RepID=UPI001FAFE7EF